MPEGTSTHEPAATSADAGAPDASQPDATAPGTEDGSGQLLEYPSAQFPGPPTVTLQVPGDWSPVRVAGALMAARKTDSADSFAPNVVVRGYVRDDDFTMADALTELTAHIQTLPEGRVDPPFDHTIGGVPFTGVNVAWTDEELGQVVQIHLFAGASRTRRVDLVQLTGSVCGDSAVEDYETVRAILETAVVGR